MRVDLIKIENDLVPNCEKFQYFSATIEQNGRFDLDVANGRAYDRLCEVPLDRRVPHRLNASLKEARQ